MGGRTHTKRRRVSESRQSMLCLFAHKGGSIRKKAFLHVHCDVPIQDFPHKVDTPIIRQAYLNAGTDTIATTVEWAMAELMANPDIRKKVQSELDDVIGPDRLPQKSDLPNLPFLPSIIKETFRLHPAAPLSLTRESHKPCEVAGHSFPAHTQLILNIFAIHHDLGAYKNPEAFQPSRFGVEHLEVNPLSRHDDFQLIPFGVGRRMCSGAQVAQSLVALMLTNLLYGFKWSLPAEQSGDMLDMN